MPEPTPERAASRMPVIFVGHGSPMHALAENQWSRGFAELAKGMPRPKAILAISAHWFVDGTWLTDNARPRTIHDFGGFPKAMYEIQYPAPGRPSLARRVRDLLTAHESALRSDWGLDHGTWCVLRWMYPEADVPVIQLSIDRRLTPNHHYAIGRALAELRDDGVLIMGSGNIVHNLRDAFGRMRRGSEETPGWAAAFDRDTAKALEQHDAAALLSMWPDGVNGRMAHPSPDHWFPLIYAQAAADERDSVRFPVTGFDAGSLSMRTVVFG